MFISQWNAAFKHCRLIPSVKMHSRHKGIHGSNVVSDRNPASHFKAPHHMGNIPCNNVFIDFTSPFAIEGPVVP